MFLQRCCGVLILCGVSVVGSAWAQLGRWGIGVGLVAPSGEYSRHDKAGWQVMAAFSPLRFGGALDLRIDALYGRTPRKTTGASTSQVFGLGTVMMIHPFRSAASHPYALAGVGYYELEEGGLGGVSSTPLKGIAFQGGLGLAVQTGGARTFLEGRFIGGPVKNGVNFIAVTLGLSF